MDRLTKEVKEYAKKCGADLVGITSMERFEGLPKYMDPRLIFPEAKSMIVIGFRIFRGIFRGIEEGTFFAPYSIMGYEGTHAGCSSRLSSGISPSCSKIRATRQYRRIKWLRLRLREEKWNGQM